MANPSALAAQLAAFGVSHPPANATVWATALRHLDPEGLRAVARAMPPASMGQSISQQLTALADERETQPFTLGGK
ncbi:MULTISPECIES: hypothetical protein [Cyanophyceae]|uniref:hypothetical protein n=1 Tax=Cyanophyceae TaxID=3028117 RepID=UPI00168A1A81|nr:MULTISPECIES: hypothetical protein [Cyanophyceae]MBD1918912.1 hypothetical protein [Phormidium sp. FACHB-77]MBD2033246.1 hypothetical protein [Phormidium sp. FACHB-322]MBD2053821.1 hypothetical protein [Leptolyngbya sp. FACHB-60]